MIKILTRVNNEAVSIPLVALNYNRPAFHKNSFQSQHPARIPGSEVEKKFQESQLIILDTLEKCLANQPKDMTRLDETLNVKSLLREICQFIGNNKNVFLFYLHTSTDN